MKKRLEYDWESTPVEFFLEYLEAGANSNLDFQVLAAIAASSGYSILNNIELIYQNLNHLDQEP
jgi:hypothetical protein